MVSDALCAALVNARDLQFVQLLLENAMERLESRVALEGARVAAVHPLANAATTKRILALFALKRFREHLEADRAHEVVPKVRVCLLAHVARAESPIVA